MIVGRYTGSPSLTVRVIGCPTTRRKPTISQPNAQRAIRLSPRCRPVRAVRSWRS